MTVLEALKQAIDTLNGISVPIPQLQSIGIPISQVTGLIQATMDAIEKGTQTEKEPEEDTADDEDEQQ